MRLSLGYLIFCAIFFHSCKNDNETHFVLRGLNDLPSEEVYDLEIFYTENAEIKMKVIASKMMRFVNPIEILQLSDGIVVNFQKDSTEKRSILECKNATINNHSNIIIARDDLKLIFFDDSVRRSILHCNTSTINTNSNIFIARENVELINNQNKRLITQELFWDQEKDSIYTDKEVKIFDNENITIARNGIRSTPDFKEYELKKGSGTIILED